MAEPVRKRGRRPRGGSAGRGARGSRGGRGRRPRIPRPSAQRTLDSEFVDLVSDSDEDILEVATARGAVDSVEVPLPERSGPAARRDDSDSDSDSEGADAPPAGAPRAPVRRRRRLLLDPGEAPAVPVYSGKVPPGPREGEGAGLGLGTAEVRLLGSVLGDQREKPGVGQRDAGFVERFGARWEFGVPGAGVLGAERAA